MSILTLAILKQRWPEGDQHISGLMEGIVNSADTVFEKYGISQCADPALVIAHMFSQFSEESGQGLEMIENMNYTAARLRQVFPTHFTPTMAQRWAHNPQAIADIAYGGRMGNAPPPSTDGWEFRGAGLSQVTGREGFTALQKTLDEHDSGFSILENPELIISPAYTLECGVADWITCGCMPWALKDDIVGETMKLNGGLNGLTERRRQLKLWKSDLVKV